MQHGVLKKMGSTLEQRVSYSLKLENTIDVNNLLGKKVSLRWTGEIICTVCGGSTKRSFGEGFCYPCFTRAPQAAECIIRPELCRAHLGEGRDVDWEDKNHNVPHVVYLAATDAVKVGVTRFTQVPTRWIDQGASAAIVLAETPNRYEAGILEVALKSFFTDKTNWQKMLKNEVDETIDLVEEKWALYDQLPSDLRMYFTESDAVTQLNYPVLEYPTKLSSIGFEKDPVISMTLKGIKGQYLIFDGGFVFNVRRHTGYVVNFEMEK